MNIFFSKIGSNCKFRIYEKFREKTRLQVCCKNVGIGGKKASERASGKNGVIKESGRASVYVYMYVYVYVYVCRPGTETLNKRRSVAVERTQAQGRRFETGLALWEPVLLRRAPCCRHHPALSTYTLLCTLHETVRHSSETRSPRAPANIASQEHSTLADNNSPPRHSLWLLDKS